MRYLCLVNRFTHYVQVIATGRWTAEISHQGEHTLEIKQDSALLTPTLI